MCCLVKLQEYFRAFSVDKFLVAKWLKVSAKWCSLGRGIVVKCRSMKTL